MSTPNPYNSFNHTNMNASAANNNIKKRRKRQRIFQKDIETLLYGMGDLLLDPTVAALEDILQEYLLDLCNQTLVYAKSQGRSRIKMTDLAFAIRNDPLKLARYEYINEQTLRIDRAKKMLDDFGEDKQGNITDDEDDDDEGNKNQKKEKKRKNKVTGNVMVDKKKAKKDD